MRSTLHGWRRRASTAALGAAAVGAVMVAGVPSVAAQDAPGLDEIVSSPNMKQVVNVPPTAPLLGSPAVAVGIVSSRRR